MERNVLVSITVAVLALIVSFASILTILPLNSQVNTLSSQLEELSATTNELKSDVTALMGKAAEREKTEAIRQAIINEGATVKICSWAYGGLWESHFKDFFREWTMKKYGVPIELTYVFEWYGTMEALLAAGKKLRDMTDVLEIEEDQIYALPDDWFDVINRPEYMDYLPIWNSIPPENIIENKHIMQQGFEWLQIVVRKDKVDPAEIKDWVDLANPKYKGRIITYPLSELRGQMIFLGIAKSLVDRGIISGPLFSEDTLLKAMEWYRDNLYPNIRQYVSTGEIRVMMQTGEAWIACTWGVYARELMGTEWNLRDDVLALIYVPHGYPLDRTTLSIAKDADHPTCARILVNFMQSPDFQFLGWYKETPKAEAINRFNVTKRMFLLTCTGGTIPGDRWRMPDWAKPYYPEDPYEYAFEIDWPWYYEHKKWIWENFQKIVLGGGE